MSEPWPRDMRIPVARVGDPMRAEWRQAWLEFHGEDIDGPYPTAAAMNVAVGWWNERARKLVIAQRLRTNPRPLRVCSTRVGSDFVAWFAQCRVCNKPIMPYVPTSGMEFFSTPGTAGDEARTHLVQKHPEHPLVL